MALKGLFNKEARRERALQKASKRSIDHRIKPEDRQPAAQTLIDDGSPEAIEALLRRFTFVYANNIVADEDEKTHIFEALRGMGDRVLDPLRKHLAGAQSISWGLRLLGETAASKEAVWRIAQEVLQLHQPGYTRDPTAKQQLVTFIGELDEVEAPAALVPYLRDDSETVRFAAVEGLLRHKYEPAREPMLQLFVDEEEESLRLRNRIADGFCELGWAVTGYRPGVERMLAEDFVVDSRGFIKRKRAKS